MKINYLQDMASHVNSIYDLNKLCVDGFAQCIYNCKSTRGQIKNVFSAHHIVSTASERIFDCVTPSGALYLDFHSPNVITQSTV